MRHLLRLLLFSIILFGCKSTPQPAVQLAEAGLYQTPIIFDTFEPPVSFDKDGGTVIKFTIPASTKPTDLFVKKKKHSLFEEIFPSAKKEEFEAVSDNKDIAASQTKQTPWWYWAIGVLVVALGVIFVLSWLKKSIPGLSFVIAFLKRMVGK